MVETIVPIVPGDLGNTKSQISPAKNWCFTLNNYTEMEINYIVPLINEYCDVGFFSKECGESLTNHLQGYIRFKTKRRPKSVFSEVDSIHWEKAKGSLQKNIDYCTKETELSFRLGVPRVPRVYSYQDLYPEQRAIIDFLSTEPDERSICVVVAPYGSGKTSLARHMVYHLKAVILPSTKRHALSVARNYLDRNIFVFDLTADESEEPPTEFFETLESLKNGLFCSAFGTKGTGVVLMDFPHVVIMSNYKPDGWCTSMDKKRFKTYEL